MTNLTQQERQMLVVFINEGVNVNGAECAEDMINDNMTWTNADDLMAELNWSKQAIGGVMASLSNKSMICDTQDSARGAKCTDWVMTDDGINYAYDNKLV
jgi:hypothetical protein